MMRHYLASLLVLALLFAGGCNESADGGDGMIASDGGAADLGGQPDAGETRDAAQQPDMIPVFGGQCEAEAPVVAAASWNHPAAAAAAVMMGEANHRIHDVILAPGQTDSLVAHFAYGLVDKDLEDEAVELWFRRCPEWESWGTLTTGSDGRTTFAVPGDLPAGEYRVRYVVKGDLTTADGVIAVWPPGTQVVVTDVDGTLTTSDWEMFEDLLGGADAEMYADADDAVVTWLLKGYRIFYLTGRPQVLNRYSRGWLHDNNFPFGPQQFAQAESIFPTDESVGQYKLDRLSQLAGMGVAWRVAYGNALTDVHAYGDTPIAKQDTYIIGPNAGAEGTQAITGYTDHLVTIAAYPDATQPW